MCHCKTLSTGEYLYQIVETVNPSIPVFIGQNVSISSCMKINIQRRSLNKLRF